MNNHPATDITVLLDGSGSMQSIKESTLGGLNAFIDEQKKATDVGTAAFSLVIFDSVPPFNVPPPGAPLVLNASVGGVGQFHNQIRYSIKRQAQPLDIVTPVTATDYMPEGGTPLNDAMARVITETGARLSAMPEAARPQHVVMVIVTDGQENDSREFAGEAGRARVAAMVEHQRAVYKWQFIYLGANQDALAVADMLSVPMANAATYTVGAQEVAAAYVGVSHAVRSARMGETASIRAEDRSKMHREH